MAQDIDQPELSIQGTPKLHKITKGQAIGQGLRLLALESLGGVFPGAADRGARVCFLVTRENKNGAARNAPPRIFVQELFFGSEL